MVSTKRKPFKFHVAYCDGHTGEYGWVADGCSERGKTELKRRLDRLMIRHARAEMWKDTPPKTRQTIRLNVGLDDELPILGTPGDVQETHLFAALEQTLHYKMPAVCDGVISDLGVGEKTIVWVLTRESVEIATSALEEATENPKVSSLMRQENVRIWATHGEASTKARNQLAAAYREHKGAGVIVATMDSMPESISLYGATTEHYAQIHYMPGPMVQSENRPYLKGTSRLHIMYYLAMKTVDERVARKVLPRVEVMANLLEEQDASDMQSILKEERKESLRDYIARLCEGTPDDGIVDMHRDKIPDHIDGG